MHDGDGSGPFERGREWFTVSVSPSGARTLTARCEMDDSEVERSVMYAVDEHDWYVGADLILVKIHWDLLKTTYVLTELSGTPTLELRSPV